MRLVLLLSLPPSSFSSWNFEGKDPVWVPDFPDWDCTRVASRKNMIIAQKVEENRRKTQENGLKIDKNDDKNGDNPSNSSGDSAEGFTWSGVDWDRWRTRLETYPMHRWPSLSCPFLPLIRPLEHQEECKVGALVASIIKFMQCKQRNKCEKKYGNISKVLLKKIGLGVLMGTRWPVFALLSSKELKKDFLVKNETLNCAHNKLIDWGEFREELRSENWFYGGMKYVFDRNIQGSWTSLLSECPFGLSLLTAWKLFVCAQSESACFDEYSGFVEQFIQDADFGEVLGGGLALVSADQSLRRHDFHLDFFPEELLSSPVLDAQRRSVDLPIQQFIKNMAEGRSPSMRIVLQSLLQHVPKEYFLKHPKTLKNGRMTSHKPEKRFLLYMSMVFGPEYNPYIPRFLLRAEALGISNLVLMTLDEDAFEICQQIVGRERCVPGTPSIANKFTLPLVYLHLGVDVFWLDFDTFLFQNPTPYLIRRAEETSSSLLVSGSLGDDCICSGIVFFKSCEETTSWLVTLTSWFFENPYAHDQKTFSAFLEARPDFDNATTSEKVSSNKLFTNFLNISPPPWALLESATKFASARVLDTTGWTGNLSEMIVFHFLHGGSEMNSDHASKGWNKAFGLEASAMNSSLLNRGPSILDIFYNASREEEEWLYLTDRFPGEDPQILEVMKRSYVSERPEELLHCGVMKLKPSYPGREDEDG